MNRFRPIPSRRGLKGGFTLVEILLSLTLLTLLLGALYGAFDIYGRLSTAGRDDVRQAQLARAILRSMQSDLQSVVFCPAESSAASGGGESESAADTESSESGDAAETSAESGETDGQSAESSARLGLTGDSETLMLYVNRPGGTRGVTAGEPEIRSVSWFLAVPNVGGIQGAVGNLAAGGGVHSSRASGVMGLARLEGDRFTLDAYDAESDLESLATFAQIVADEVNYLQFAYFDGTEWTDTWDSSASEGLPRAVEIQIGLRPPQSAAALDEEDRQRLGMDEEIGLSFRLVVALPAASTSSSATDTSSTSLF